MSRNNPLLERDRGGGVGNVGKENSFGRISVSLPSMRALNSSWHIIVQIWFEGSEPSFLVDLVITLIPSFFCFSYLSSYFGQFMSNMWDNHLVVIRGLFIFNTSSGWLIYCNSPSWWHDIVQIWFEGSELSSWVDLVITLKPSCFASHGCLDILDKWMIDLQWLQLLNRMTGLSHKVWRIRLDIYNLPPWWCFVISLTHWHVYKPWFPFPDT